MTRPLGKPALLTIVVFALAGGCIFRTIAPYDDRVARGLHDLESRVTSFFDDMQSQAGTPNGSWESFADCYDAIRGDLALVRVQAAARDHNELTLRSLDLLKASVDDLEAMHQTGVTSREIAIVRSLIETQMRMLHELERGKKGAPPEVSP